MVFVASWSPVVVGCRATVLLPFGTGALAGTRIAWEILDVEGFMVTSPCYDTPMDVLVDPRRLTAVAQLLPRGEDVSPVLQRFIDEVAGLLRAPCAGVSLILDDAGVLLATHGVGGWLAEAGGMPAQWAPCATVVRQDAPLLIVDTHDDPAHTTNPLVMITGVRSYAGVPLHLDGQAVGSLCVLAAEPGRFTHADLDTLISLAPRAVALLQQAAGD
ncbi:GAF domain-containing protein [Actinoplanes xinjiangensis]|uniref:GAF domain-containing protein n=1 Tax=Actinoplanes xinjiangensis TaxID=512350 RepID=UPI00344AC3AD